MPETRHILIADDPPIGELISRLEQAVERAGEAAEVAFGEAHTEEAEGVTTRVFADSAEGGHAVTLVEDPRAGRYVVVAGERADAIAGVLAEALPAEGLEHVVERAGASGDPREVLRVALAHRDAPSPEAIGVVVTALRSTDRERVRAGIAAAAMTDPARFAGDLHRLAAEGPDHGLRRMAEQALAEGGRG